MTDTAISGECCQFGAFRVPHPCAKWDTSLGPVPYCKPPHHVAGIDDGNRQYCECRTVSAPVFRGPAGVLADISGVLRESFAEYARDLGSVDTMDDFDPTPLKGHFFAELVVRGEIQLDSGLHLIGENKEEKENDVAPKRARVRMLSEVPPEGGWDFWPDYEVLVPYFAGSRYEWMNQKGITESLWIISASEVIAVFKPRKK